MKWQINIHAQSPWVDVPEEQRRKTLFLCFHIWHIIRHEAQQQQYKCTLIDVLHNISKNLYLLY